MASVTQLSSLQGLRIVVSQAAPFMGPALCEALADRGAAVLADEASLDGPGAGRALVERSGRVDVLVANLAITAPSTAAGEVQSDEWRAVFAALVDPLPELLRALLPQWRECGGGKLLLMGSAAALRGMRHSSTYSAARGAQLAWVQAVGVELAREQIQVNAIAQNLVDNPTYFLPAVQADPRFQARIRREMPLGRLVRADEDAAFAAYLCSPAAHSPGCPRR